MEYHIILIVLCILLIASLIKLNQAGFACLGNPCAHGICIDDLNSTHNCYCMDGFTGWSCEQNWDECRASTGMSPCLNGGVCTDGIASFNCTCPEPYTGNVCQYNLSHCDDFPCQNNGTCTFSSESDHDAGLMCICPMGFTGVHCEEDVSMCNNVSCLNGGKCIDDVGKKFYCQCEQGWSGHLCQLSTDECASAPCQNGAICVDKINDFSCACPFGYTGKSCETKLDICDENPCKNGAFCLQEEGQKVCYCVPDFHGPLCAEQYNECDPPTKCSNGGTCIDGVGTFNCSCPPTFFGQTCQCSHNDEMSEECSELLQNLRTTESTTTTTTTNTAPAETRGDGGNVSVVVDLIVTSIYGLSTQYISPFPTATVPVLPSWTILMSSDSPYDPGGVSIKLSSWSIREGIDDMSDSEHFSRSIPTASPSHGIIIPTHAILDPTPVFGTTVVLATPTLITTFIEETAAPVDRQSETYDPCPSLIVSIEETETMDQQSFTVTSPPLLSIKDISTTPFQITPTFDNIPSQVMVTSKIDELEVTSTISQISSSHHFPLSSSLDPNELISEFPPAFLTSTLKTPLLSTSFDSSLWEVPDSDSYTATYPYESLPVLETSSIFYSIETSRLLGESSSIILLYSPTVPGQSLSLNSSSIIGGDISHLVTSTFVDSTILVSSEWRDYESSFFRTQDIGASHLVGRDDATFSNVYVTPLPSSTMSTNFVVDPTRSVESPLVSPTVTVTPPTVTNVTNPCHNYCQNNATCVSVTIEPICLCPFKFIGLQCEKKQEEVQIPSFSGESFLKYELQRASADIIEISAQMATVVPDGILLYSTIGRIYALIYIQNGLVTLHFSCGAQSMHFVETRTRVDNGFNFTLAFRLENVLHGQKELRCVSQVSLNESYSMRGEQIVDGHTISYFDHHVKTVFLGGLDKPDLYTNDDIIRILPGFRGCVYRLQVNEELLSMFQDAKDGRDISQCSTFGCVVNPCAGQSRCIPSRKYPFWQCTCPPGFEGIRCNIRTCGVNPCKNGAICTIHSNHSRHHFTNESSSAVVSKMCLCPLGFTGDLCQSRINVTRPSFHSTPDYSSFIAYEPIPRFADWMQLRFNFITRNISQFALLMYAGSDLQNINVITRQQLEKQQQLESPPSIHEHDQFFPATDFFALSFLQGFIALTWNLGSGTQRIVTPSRIDNQLNVHTLFAGRQGKVAWLKVDGMKNISGKTPGILYRLNVNSDLFVGGHEVPRFEGLPHDIPLHSGFQGCIFDLGFRVKNKLFLPRALRGIDIKNCYHDEDC